MTSKLSQPVPVFEARNVSVSFGGVQALKSVSLQVDPQSIVGLIGPNGAGKTTLFNCISGFSKPDAGEFLFHGRNIGMLAPHQRALIGLGRTFQNVGLCKDESIFDNLMIAQHRSARYPAIAGMFGVGVNHSERALERRADELLEMVGLRAHRNHKVNELSAGLMRIAELACILSARPRLLLLDEPAAGLSPEATDRMRDVILQVQKEQDLSILMIGHVMRLIMNVSEHIYVLKYGEVIARGTPAEIRANPLVTEAYMGRESESPAPSKGGAR